MMFTSASALRRIVLRPEPGMFRLVMDAIMLAAGLSMPWNAAFS
jgi:hypothetical protein